jgi:hypothetical protein
MPRVPDPQMVTTLPVGVWAEADWSARSAEAVCKNSRRVDKEFIGKP